MKVRSRLLAVRFVIAVASGVAWCPSWSADPYPSAGKSTVQFTFTSGAPIGTVVIKMGRGDVEAWEQPAYPGGRPTFTVPPGRYPIEFPGDPALHFIEAKPQMVTLVTIGGSNSGRRYRIVEQQHVAPHQLPSPDQGATPLQELGPAIAFVLRPNPASPRKR